MGSGIGTENNAMQSNSPDDLEVGAGLFVAIQMENFYFYVKRQRKMDKLGELFDLSLVILSYNLNVSWIFGV